MMRAVDRLHGLVSGARATITLVGALAIVAACAGTPATSGPTSAASPSAVASTSSSPVASTTPPRPSPSPSTAQLLQKHATAEPWQASATLTGTAAGKAGTVSGTLAVFNDDASLSLTTTILGETTTTEQIMVGDASYLRAPGERWRRDLPADGMVRAISLRAALLAASYAEPAAGTLMASGRDAARIAESLGLVDPGAVPDNATATLTLGGQGGLATLRLAYDNGGRWDVAYDFAETPSVSPIAAPKDAVVLDYHPKQVLLFYPDGWTMKAIGKGTDVFDVFVAPSGSELVFAYCIQTDLPLKAWTAEGRKTYSEELKAKVSSTGTQEINGLTWNLTQWKDATSFISDEPALAVNVAGVHAGLACDVQWHGPEDGAGVNAALNQFVGTLKFLN